MFGGIMRPLPDPLQGCSARWLCAVHACVDQGLPQQPAMMHAALEPGGANALVDPALGMDVASE